MKLALFETNILWENKQGNLAKLAGVLEDLSISGRLPQVIALPEMSFTGFSMNTRLTAEIVDENGDSETILKIKELAVRYGITICFGWVKKVDEGFKAENHYTIVNSKGEILLDYAKIHPFSYSGEDEYFTGGENVYTCCLDEFNAGAAICYDLRFPEVFQAMSDKAELIFLPANWPARRQAHLDILSVARAIENQCYIAKINCRGKVGELDYIGGTALISPNGDLVEAEKELIFDEDKLYIYEFQNDVDTFRTSFPTRKDRKTDLYLKILRKS